mgnify:CR=1 FL=1
MLEVREIVEGGGGMEMGHQHSSMSVLLRRTLNCLQPRILVAITVWVQQGMIQGHRQGQSRCFLFHVVVFVVNRCCLLKQS